jgi:two-component system chemotaxis sensor kinase CheA
VVRDAVARLKGEIDIETTPGQGTSVELRVPVSLAASVVLLVEDSGMVGAVPLDSVRECLRLERGTIADAGTGATILYGGRAVPYLRMPEVWGRACATDGGANGAAVILEAGDSVAAIGVDRLIGTTTVLMRSLPVLAGADPVVAGAALDAEGNPLLILDPEALAAEAKRARHPTAPVAGSRQKPILIIDDSLTTRMVEQSVLESAGHLVECAASAEEALEKAHQRRYSLFLVDVEMPGLDGYQFVSAAKADPLLREIPSILVTSRGSTEDRQRGAEAGARAYIVKSEFDQTQFLETVRRLVA